MVEEKEITLEELKKQVAQENHSADQSGKRIQLIVFKLAGEEYALPIDDIKEVVLTPGIAKVPQTPSYIKGVANIRGNLIAIVDLEEKFGLRKAEDGSISSGNYTLVIEGQDVKIGVLVKEVPNTLSINTNNIDNSSGIMKYSSLDESAIKGIVKVDNRMVILIDVLTMMQTQEIKDLTKI